MGLINRFKNLFIASDSDKFQEMLVSIRIYLGFLSNKRIINLSVFSFFAIYFLFIVYMFIPFRFNILPKLNVILIFSLWVSLYFLIIYFTILFFSLKDEYYFSFKGILTLIRERKIFLVVFFWFIYLLFGLILFYYSVISFSLFFNNIIAVTLLTLFVILIVLVLHLSFGLKASSFFKYAKKTLEEIINSYDPNSVKNNNIKPTGKFLNFINKLKKIDERIDNYFSKEDKHDKIYAKYRIFYYSIYYAYKRISNGFEETYGKDVNLMLKIDHLPILASQIITEYNFKRRQLLQILSELEKIKIMEKPEKFVEIMKETKKTFGDSFDLNSKNIELKELFKKRTFVENIKTYLVPLIPIIVAFITVLADFYLKNKTS